jgi:type III secretory pathway component EscT
MNKNTMLLPTALLLSAKVSQPTFSGMLSSNFGLLLLLRFARI